MYRADPHNIPYKYETYPLLDGEIVGHFGLASLIVIDCKRFRGAPILLGGKIIFYRLLSLS